MKNATNVINLMFSRRKFKIQLMEAKNRRLNYTVKHKKVNHREEASINRRTSRQNHQQLEGTKECEKNTPIFFPSLSVTSNILELLQETKNHTAIQ